jgi:hypothetical protein
MPRFEVSYDTSAVLVHWFMMLERAILRRSASAENDSIRHQRTVLMLDCLVVDLECDVQVCPGRTKVLYVVDARRASHWKSIVFGPKSERARSREVP